MRRKINGLDLRAAAILVERFRTAERIGRLKKKSGLAVRDAKREREVLERVSARCGEYSKSVKSVFRTVIKESRGMQK